MDQQTNPASPAATDLDAFLGTRPPSPRARYLRWGAIGLGVLILLWIGWALFGPSGNSVNYATRALHRGSLTVTISATGNLKPTKEVDVGSELSGTVIDVFVDNNDKVVKGQVLARLDTKRLQDTLAQSRAQLASAQAGLAQAQATANQTRANLARLEEVYRLSGGKVPSRTELDTGRADDARAIAGIGTARAAVAQATAQVSSDQTQLGKATILSPVNGVVLSRQIEPGQTVAASLNAPVLFQIAQDLREMQLEVKVDEADVGQVKNGQKATFQVDAFPGRTFPAVIQRVDLGANAGTSGSSSSSSSASASSTTGSVVAYNAILTVSNPDELLRPGMTATAEIVTTERDNVLLAPNAALRFTPDQGGAKAGQGGGLTSVLAPPRPRRGNAAARSASIGRGSQQTLYILGDDGTPQPVKVIVGDSNGSETEVSGAGLKEGMQVITGQLAAGETGKPDQGAAAAGDQAGARRARRSGGDGQ